MTQVATFPNAKVYDVESSGLGELEDVTPGSWQRAVNKRAMELRRIDAPSRGKGDTTWLRRSMYAGSGLPAAKLTARKEGVRVDLGTRRWGDRQTAWMTGPKKLAHGHGAETTRPWLKRQVKEDRGFKDN
jgi:hypothetical protein